MNIADSLLVTRIIIIFGMVNLLTALLIFFSCRCLPPSKIGGTLMKYRPFQRLYRYHCYLWRVFWSSVVIHTILVVIFLGWPT